MADGIENFTLEYQRNFELMRDLDRRTENLRAEIEKLTTKYMSRVHNLSSEERVTILKQTWEACAKWKEFSDNKLQIATQSYEMIDKHIQQLGMPVSPFDADLKEKLTDSSEDDSSCSKTKQKAQTQKKNTFYDLSKGKNSDEDALEAVKKLKFECLCTEYGMSSGTSGSVSTFSVLDMPVDPHEATSCPCSQGTCGERIHCDNPDAWPKLLPRPEEEMVF